VLDPPIMVAKLSLVTWVFLGLLCAALIGLWLAGSPAAGRQRRQSLEARFGARSRV
jgi:hypothetical protein